MVNIGTGANLKSPFRKIIVSQLLKQNCQKLYTFFYLDALIINGVPINEGHRHPKGYFTRWHGRR